MITGFLGLAIRPWKLMASPDAYIFGWLGGYAGLMGPIAGIMICDYFFIRHTKLSIYSLYHREGIYHYSKGFNPRAIAALVLGVVIALIGLWIPSLHFLYDYSWFVGLFLSGIAYAVLMQLWPVPVMEPAIA
jgi:NCS1 family nucleobase:cation symporter-1